MNKQKVIDAIDSLAKLEQDWDSRGADVISPKAILAAKLFVENIPAGTVDPLLVGPTYDGGVYLEWRTEFKWLDFEFLSEEEEDLTRIEFTRLEIDELNNWSTTLGSHFRSDVDSLMYQVSLGELSKLASKTQRSQ